MFYSVIVILLQSSFLFQHQALFIINVTGGSYKIFGVPNVYSQKIQTT